MRGLAVALLFVLAACTPLDLVKPMLGGGGPSLEVEAIVGDKNQEVRVGDTAQTINKTEEVPLKYMVLMILGWLLPSPREIWKGAVSLLPWMKNRNTPK
jgi:hypothetical protein